MYSSKLRFKNFILKKKFFFKVSTFLARVEGSNVFDESRGSYLSSSTTVLIASLILSRWISDFWSVTPKCRLSMILPFLGWSPKSGMATTGTAVEIASWTNRYKGFVFKFKYMAYYKPHSCLDFTDFKGVISLNHDKIICNWNLD